MVGSFFLLDAINAPTSFLNVSARPNLSVWNLTEEQWKSPLVRFEYLVFARQWRGQTRTAPVTRNATGCIVLGSAACSGLSEMTTPGG